MPKLDRYDLEAEREGNAIKLNAVNRVLMPMGKRILKIRREHRNGNQKLQTRIEKRYL